MWSLLTSYKAAIEIGLVAAIGIGLTIGAHVFMDHQQDIGYQRATAEFNARQVAIDAAQQKIEADLRDQLEKAENAAKIRQDVNASAAASAVAVSNSLLGTLAAIRASSSTATVDALRSTTAALTTVFADCQERYTTLAKAADGHASDVKTLMDAWPQQH